MDVAAFQAGLRALRQGAGDAPRIYVPGVAAEPYIFDEAIGAEPELAREATFFGIWIPGVNRTDWTRHHPTSRSELIFLSPDFEPAFTAGRASFRPLTYTQSWAWLEQTRVDAAIIQVSPPDAKGLCSFSAASDFTTALIDRTEIILAQINPALQAMPGAPTIERARLTAEIEVETSPRGYEAGASPPAFAAIADQISALVRDGDTLQFGLGKVQLAVLPTLTHHRDLTIHSGMVSDPLLELLDGPQIRAIRTGAVLGGRALHAALSHDRRVTMTPVRDTHAVRVLAGLERFTAINSVIEVDLFGQANGEFVGGRQVSGGGGLLDFARGAQASRGGRAIFALASTAKMGAVSRIVPRLDAGAVTLTRADVEIVVTEHGVADLRQGDIDQRAERRIDIAAPEHRAALSSAWDEMRRAM